MDTRRIFTPELIATICSHLCASAGRSDLLAFSRTCRTFYEPAMDIVWRSLPNLAPLILTMPPDAWTAELRTNLTSLDNEVIVLSFVRPLVPADFVRMLLYCPRVKSFGGFENRLKDTIKKFNLAFSAVNALEAFRPASSLLPNVEYLEWDYFQYAFGECGLPAIHFLFGSRLRTVHLWPMGGPCNANNVYQTLQKLTAKSPALQHFSLSSYSKTAELCELMPALLSGLPQLVDFKADIQLNAAALLKLACLPDLRTINVQISATTDLTDVLNDYTKAFIDSPFPALKDVTITLNDLSHVADLLLHIGSSSLRRLSVTLGTHPSAGCIKTLSLSLATLYETSLQVLMIEVGRIPDNDSEGHIVRREALQPLLRLEHLRVLDIQGCPVDLDDDLLRDMALAWPKLERLELGGERGSWVPNPRATLLGLIPLAQHCRHLQYVGLVFDTQCVGTAEECEQRPGGGVRNRLVEELGVGNSIIKDPVPIASFLSSLFPNLWYICRSWPHEDDAEEDDAEEDFEMSRRWTQCAQLAREFARVRKQERKWQKSARAIEDAPQ